MPRATASQSFRVEPRQLHFSDAPEGITLQRVGKILYTGRQRDKRGRGRVEVLEVTWGTLKYPDAKTKEIRPGVGGAESNQTSGFRNPLQIVHSTVHPRKGESY